MKVGYRKNKFSEFPIVKGRERVLLIGANEKRRSLFAIVELDGIIASHNEKSFGNSKGYPLDENGRNVNDRNYAKDKNAQSKVKSVAQNLEPNMIISTSVNPSGTPIISEDGIVVSGNNRVMSLKLAKSDYPKKYKEYLDALMKEINYGGYGIKYAQIFGEFKNPVLVRIDKDFKEYNSTELNKYNVVREKSEKQIDKSIRISQLLQKNEGCKNKLIDLINEQEVVSELYNNVRSVARFKSILLECELITENDISALFTSNSLSEQGKIMYNTVLLSLVLNEKSLEISQNSGIKSYTKNVVNAILPLIKNKSLSKGSLINFVNDSFLIQNDLVNGGFKHLNDYIKQSKLGFEEESNEFKNKKALIINEVVNSGFSKLKNTLIRYNNSMEKNIEPDMFGEQLGEEEIFDKTFGVEVDAKTINLISKMAMKQDRFLGEKPDGQLIIDNDKHKIQLFNEKAIHDYNKYKVWDFPTDIGMFVEVKHPTYIKDILKLYSLNREGVEEQMKAIKKNKSSIKPNFRIHTKDGRIKFAGTGQDSWFFSIESARKKLNTSKGEKLYEYDFDGYPMHEVMVSGLEDEKQPKQTEKQKSIQAKIRIYERLLTKAKGEKKNTIESKLRIYNRLLKA